MFCRFNDITVDDVLSDFHIHSNWTDGESSVVEIANKAEELELRRIAITDHVRKDSTYFDEYYNEIKEIREKKDIDILAGFEAKVLNFDGDVDVSSEILNQAEVKIVSVHRFPLGRKLFEPAKFTKELCQEIELELTLSALKNKDFNVLGHPGGMSLKFFNEFPVASFEKIIEGCCRLEIAFDINSSYHHLVIEGLLPLLRKHNPFVVFGSDAHTLDEIGRWSEKKEIFYG